MPPSEHNFQAFDSTEDAVSPEAEGQTRPVDRPRVVGLPEGDIVSEFVTFECPVEDLPAGSTPRPRPVGRERPRTRTGNLPDEVQSLLGGAVAALPPEYRQILQLRLGGDSIANIAQAIGSTPQQVLDVIGQLRTLFDRDSAA